MMQIQQDIWAYSKKLVHIYPFQLCNVIMCSHGWFPHSFPSNLKLLSWHHYNMTGAYGLKNSSMAVINVAFSPCKIACCQWTSIMWWKMTCCFLRGGLVVWSYYYMSLVLFLRKSTVLNSKVWGNLHRTQLSTS